MNKGTGKICEVQVFKLLEFRFIIFPFPLFGTEIMRNITENLKI